MMQSIFFTPQPIKYVPKTGGSGIIVPRPAFLTYSDYILKMVTKNGKVLQKLFGIKKLAFSTGFNGTRVFVRSALVPLDEIFGGGRTKYFLRVALKLTLVFNTYT